MWSENGAGKPQITVVTAKMEAIGIDQLAKREIVVDQQQGVMAPGEGAQGVCPGNAFGHVAGFVAELDNPATACQCGVHFAQQLGTVGHVRRDGIKAAPTGRSCSRISKAMPTR